MLMNNTTHLSGDRNSRKHKEEINPFDTRKSQADIVLTDEKKTPQTR